MNYRVDVRKNGTVYIRIKGVSHLGDVGFVDLPVYILPKPENFQNYPPSFVDTLWCPVLEIDFGVKSQNRRGEYVC